MRVHAESPLSVALTLHLAFLRMSIPAGQFNENRSVIEQFMLCARTLSFADIGRVKILQVFKSKLVGGVDRCHLPVLGLQAGAKAVRNEPIATCVALF